MGYGSFTWSDRKHVFISWRKAVFLLESHSASIENYQGAQHRSVSDMPFVFLFIQGRPNYLFGPDQLIIFLINDLSPPEKGLPCINILLAIEAAPVPEMTGVKKI